MKVTTPRWLCGKGAGNGSGDVHHLGMFNGHGFGAGLGARSRGGGVYLPIMSPRFIGERTPQPDLMYVTVIVPNIITWR